MALEAGPPDGGPALVLHDEEGREFAFHPVRALRDGTDVFLLAERPETGTLHVLKREGDLVGLVRDPETLGRVALRLEVLRRAMEGELIEASGPEPRFFGVFHRGEVEGEPYLLAADLADPAQVVAFEPGPEGLRPLDERRLVLVQEQLQEAVGGWEAARPGLEAAVLGLRGETVEVREDGGRTRRFEAAGRLFFEGRDLLFLKSPAEPDRAIAFEVKGGGRIEAVSDEPYLERLRAHLESFPAVRA